LSTSIIFDLDSCLCAADELGRHLYEPAFQAIRDANAGLLPEERLSQAFAECWRFPFDEVATRYCFSAAMRRSGFRAFSAAVVTTSMHGYGDLDVLRELDAQLFLVTSGFRRLQESKIAALGIAELFKAVRIDAIDDQQPRGKRRIFAELLDQFRLKARETIVVGDNPDSEIAAGNSLGMVTVQILRPGVRLGGNASHTISTLSALKEIALRRGG
jgi:phosphoglycolate phosphatase-like HAD superfamily hydrolase